MRASVNCFCETVDPDPFITVPDSGWLGFKAQLYQQRYLHVAVDKADIGFNKINVQDSEAFYVRCGAGQRLTPMPSLPGSFDPPPDDLPGRGGRPAHHKFRRQNDAAGAAVRAVNMVEKQLRRLHAHLMQRNPDGRQRWREHIDQRHVVVADH
jgi:hypothetical protein